MTIPYTCFPPGIWDHTRFNFDHADADADGNANAIT